MADMTTECEIDLTIVTVCRNARNLLLPTLESVVAQKAKETLSIEHLIIDGASTDGTPEWLAELQAEGKIENYISEPDAGIYDAMNKGIRLSKGKVLYFLNAGDVLTGASLQESVSPLLQGKASTAAAPVLMKGDTAEWVDSPSFDYVYLGTPVCHQGYFATAALYRELGGYDSQHYRCLADADFMNRAYVASGAPHMTTAPVAVYATGGFSESCGYRFLPEYLYMRNLHWDKVLQRGVSEPAYAELITYALIDHSTTMLRWVQEFGIAGSNADILLRHVSDQRRVVRSWRQRMMLLWIEKCCLKPMLAGSLQFARAQKVLKWLGIAGSLNEGNPYIHPEYYPSRSLKAALKALIRSRFCS